MPLSPFEFEPPERIENADKIVAALNECLTYERAAAESLLTMARGIKTRKFKKLAVKIRSRAKTHREAIWSLDKRISHPLLGGDSTMKMAGVEWKAGDTVSILQAALDLMRAAHDCYERAVDVTVKFGDSVSRHYHIMPNLKRVDRDIMWFAAQLQAASEATVGEYQVEWMS